MKRFSQYMLLVALSAFSPSCGEKAKEADTESPPKSQNENVDITNFSNKQIIDSLPDCPDFIYSTVPLDVKSVSKAGSEDNFLMNAKVRVYEEKSPLLKPYEKILSRMPDKERKQLREALWKKRSLVLEAQKQHENLKGDPEAYLEWRMRWNNTAQKTLDAAYKQELEIRRRVELNRQPVTEEDVSEFKQRLVQDEPVFSLSDLAIIEHIMADSIAASKADHRSRAIMGPRPRPGTPVKTQDSDFIQLRTLYKALRKELN